MVWFFLYCWLDIRIRNKRFSMKIFLTEVIKDNQPLIGPYIKAETMDKAIEIADMYALTIIGELHELSHTMPKQQETIH